MKDLASIPLPPIDAGSIIEPEIEWLRAPDGMQLACRSWRGKVGYPVVLYLHGIEGHSQWFENTASALNSKGITVYAPDRRGSGLNSRDRGHIESHKIFLADVEELLKLISTQHRKHPVVLMGNCWAAKAAVLIASENYKGICGPLPLTLSGLILTCPALYTKVDFDLKTKINIAYMSWRGGRMSMKQWPIPLTVEMFTHNELYLQYLRKDPLRIEEATARFFFETYLLGKMSQKACSHLRLPTLILQSANDQVVDVIAVQKWFEKIAAQKKEFRIYPDAAHSIDFDPVWFKEYTHLLNEWILALSPVSAR